eukprot:8427113-Alexandrium_andersonii.AAC.1
MSPQLWVQGSRFDPRHSQDTGLVSLVAGPRPLTPLTPNRDLCMCYLDSFPIVLYLPLRLTIKAA